MSSEPQEALRQNCTALPVSHAKNLKQLKAVAEQWLEKSTIVASKILMGQKKRCSFKMCAEECDECYFNVLMLKLYLHILQIHLKWFCFFLSGHL